MNNKKSWLSTSYSTNTYDLDVDSDFLVAKRRKALNELRGLIREKCLQQIVSAIKEK